MILQKLGAAIQRQDWFQVVIEVLIVIVGIFLGLQVQEWNEDRTDRIEEQGHLIALKEDITASIGAIELSINGKETIKVALNRLAALGEGDFGDIDTQSLNADISMGLFDMSQFTYQMNVYEHLKTSGQLSLIEDEDLKLLLTKIGSQIDTHNRGQVGELDAQYVTIDAYLIKNHPMGALLKNFPVMEDFNPHLSNEAPDYERFVLDMETQNLIAYKFFFMSNNINSLTEILGNYQLANTMIDQRLAELGETP